jgi:hypothetical protein
MRLPVCGYCWLEMRPVKNEVIVVFLQDNLQPDTVYLGDEYQCEKCERKFITGLGREPIILFTDHKFKDRMRKWIKEDGERIRLVFKNPEQSGSIVRFQDLLLGEEL